MDIIKAINDEHLFRSFFKNLETWASWITFLKALFCLPMTEDELALYRQCTGREKPPEQPFREAWVPTGRRSGKSFTAALVSVFLACFRDYRPHLAPGERAHILVIAADRKQAQNIFRYIRDFLFSNQMLHKLVESESKESIDLINLVSLEVATCSFRSIRGFTAAAVICDEIAYWRDDTAANPDVEVLRAIRPALETIPGSLLLCISSPYAKSGVLYQTFTAHHGRDDSDVLCWRAGTRLMNPCISQKSIDRSMADDPEAARSEWEAEFRADLATFLDPTAIQAVIFENRYELPPLPGVSYKVFFDHSSGHGDAAALCVGHREKGGKIILDVARRWPSPHDPSHVIAEVVQICKSYRVSRIVADKYAVGFLESELRKHSFIHEASEKDRSILYLEFAPLVLSGQVELLDNPVLFHELRNLERRTRGGGHDSVDHPKGKQYHDDLSNACAGCCVGLAVKSVSFQGLLDWYAEEAARVTGKAQEQPAQEDPPAPQEPDSHVVRQMEDPFYRLR